MKLLLSGNHAAAYAARLARAEVIPVYPITPQTEIMEKIAEFLEASEMEAEYLPVESEHSAMAAALGAAAMGARVFTATSSHGLLYMHEMLHWVAGSRLPVVMVNVNRAVGPGWNLWADHQDSVSQRDTGWLQLYCASQQEVLDSVLQAFRVAEDKRVMLPIMVNIDAFVLSHAVTEVDVPEREAVDSFLPIYEPLWYLRPESPTSLGSSIYPQHYAETRFSMHQAQLSAKSVIEEVRADFARRFGRDHGGLLQQQGPVAADNVLVAMGSLGDEAALAVEALCGQGPSSALVRVRSLRPFPGAELAAFLSSAQRALVFERAVSFGQGAPLASELRSALREAGVATPVWSFLAGFGGRDVPYTLLVEAALAAQGKEPPTGSLWLDLHPEKQPEVAAGRKALARRTAREEIVLAKASEAKRR